MPTPMRPISTSCPLGPFSLTAVAVTVSVSGLPSRSATMSNVWPPRFWIACMSSSGVNTAWPATARTQSPTRRPEIVTHDARHDADPDAPDLDLLPAGPFLPDGGGRDGQRLGLAVAFRDDVERLAATLLDRLHELVGREHRLARDRQDPVPDAQARDRNARRASRCRPRCARSRPLARWALSP